MDEEKEMEDGVEVVTPGEDGAEVAEAPAEMPAHEVPTPTASSDEGMKENEDDMDDEVKVGDEAATAE